MSAESESASSQNTCIESAFDISKCSKKSSVTDNVELLLLAPAIDGVTTSHNSTVKGLMFDFLSDSKRKL